MSESLLLCNGRVYSLDESSQPVDSIAISTDGTIAALGSREECATALGSPDREIDLEGKTVLPGFHDPMGRVVRESAARAFIDLSGLRGLPEIFGTIEKVVKEVPKGEWIRGYGWSKGQWGWARFPHRGDLDLVSPHHPVVLYSGDERVAWLNSEAIRCLGINAQSPNPPGGVIERDSATRAATGILKENAVDTALRNLPQFDRTLVKGKVSSVLDDYLRMGVVSVCSSDSLLGARLLIEWADSLSSSVNIVCHPPFALGEELLEKDLRTGSKIGTIELGGLRIYVDGTLASQTAWMKEPYGEDWNEFGVQILSEEDLRDRTGWCYRHGFAPILYASGDAACELAIKVYSDLDGFRGNLRPTLINADLLDEKNARKAAGLGVQVATNPRRIETEREVGKMFWGTRWDRALNLESWAAAGLDILYGSGGPLRDWSPLKGLKAALNRDGSLESGVRLEPREGLRALTTPWVGLGRGSKAGLKVGNAADCVILDGDPLEVPVNELDSIPISGAIVNGEFVFEPRSESNAHVA